MAVEGSLRPQASVPAQRGRHPMVGREDTLPQEQFDQGLQTIPLGNW